MGNDVPGGARSRVRDPVRWKDGKDKWAQTSRAGGGAFRDKARDAECGRCAAELTLDQPLNGLRRPLSSRFSSSNHDCHGGAHAKMEVHAPGGVRGALRRARARN